MTRRKFLWLLFSSPLVPLLYANGIERRWLKKTNLEINENGTKIAHFTDLHYKGDRRLYEEVIQEIYDSQSEIAVFTGDLIDHDGKDYLDEVLEITSQIKIPVYGVPGNHDPRDHASIEKYRMAFAKTGGGWLINKVVPLKDIDLYGFYNMRLPKSLDPNRKNLLLTHYPATCDVKTDLVFDLILVGHSHGGQVRLPFFGPIVLPKYVGNYDKGFYETKMGKLYVNVGIGTFMLPARFLCRPELTFVSL
jgi:predicted MPP superfamily phosphohydrolase